MATGWGTNELVSRRPAANAYEQARRGSAAGLAGTLSSRGIGVNAAGGLGQAAPATSMDSVYGPDPLYRNAGQPVVTPTERGGGLSPVSERLNSASSTTPPAQTPATPVAPGQVIPPGTPNTPGGPTAPPGAAGAIANTLVNNGQTVTPTPAAAAPAPFVPVTTPINTDNGSYYSQTTPAGGSNVWNPNGGGTYYVPEGGYGVTNGLGLSNNGPTAGAPFGTDDYGNPFQSQAQADDWRQRSAARDAALAGYTFNDAYRNAGVIA